MPEGLLGRKIGMTSVFVEGISIPVTVIEVGPCPVVQVKSADGPDGYDAVQLGLLPKKASRVNRAMAGHFAGAGVKPTRILREFRGMTPREVGKEVRVEDIFSQGDVISVRGRSKGRGFTGVMKRHGFHGHKSTHGTHESFRGAGSLGAGTSPGRVWKGSKMSGHYGDSVVTKKNLRVVRVIADRNLLLVTGAVPGARNSVLELHKG